MANGANGRRRKAIGHEIVNGELKGLRQKIPTMGHSMIGFGVSKMLTVIGNWYHIQYRRD
jgi:hypothetical protein